LKPLERSARTSCWSRGLTNTAAQKVVGGGDHAKATGSFLSGAPPKRTVGADVQSGVTFDQVLAKQTGRRNARAVAAVDLRRHPHGGQLRHRFQLRLHQ
jgi:hypothetical protein